MRQRCIEGVLADLPGTEELLAVIDDRGFVVAWTAESGVGWTAEASVSRAAKSVVSRATKTGLAGTS